MKRMATVLIGATVALGGGALVMGQAFASGPAAVTHQVDRPSGGQHEGSDDRVSGVDDPAIHDANDANDDRVTGVEDRAPRASDAPDDGRGRDSTRDQAEHGGN